MLYIMGSKRLSNFSPGQIVIFSILCTILIGTALLSLPAARTAPLSIIDLFFTATSATCVTGLFTISLDNFTLFGQCILLLLIQVGGLGLITLTLFIMSLFVNLGFATQLMAGQILEIEAWQNVKRMLFFIITLTLIIELCGALILLPTLIAHYPLEQAAFFSIFHSVSSFCNAGVSLFNYSTYKNLLIENYVVLGITALLTFFGGLGFITWLEFFRYFRSLNKKKHYHFSLLTKIVLWGSLVLIIVPTVLIWILEHNNTLAHMGLFESWYNAACNAIALRSSGFLTVPVYHLNLATLLVIMAVAFIGAAPGSTGSGVRVSTFIIFLATIKAAIFGETRVNLQGRRIPKDQIYKAVALVSVGAFWIIGILFLLLITEKNADFLDMAFESVSAFANLGISTGITSLLSPLGKIFIIVTMIVGRIGSLTLILALRKTRLQEQLTKVQISYPEERIMLS